MFLSFQIDIISVLPFDLLCLYFEFSAVYRVNRFIRVGNRLVLFC